MPDRSAEAEAPGTAARIGNDVEVLIGWYGSAGYFVDGLEACAVVAAGMLESSAEANRRATLLLDRLVRNADLWLVTHPCPTSWNAEFLAAIIGTAAGIGRYVEETDGAVLAVDAAYLAEQSTRLDWMVGEVRGLMSDLESLGQARRPDR
jgi:hypothetical protein